MLAIPVCIRICLSNWLGFWKLLLQCWHLWLPGLLNGLLSGWCIIRCSFKWPDLLKDFEQIYKDTKYDYSTSVEFFFFINSMLVVYFRKHAILFPKLQIIAFLFSILAKKSLVLITAVFAFFHLLARRPNLEKFSIYLHKFFHNFHLPESSFTCPGLSGLAQRLLILS